MYETLRSKNKNMLWTPLFLLTWRGPQLNVRENGGLRWQHLHHYRSACTDALAGYDWQEELLWQVKHHTVCQLTRPPSFLCPSPSFLFSFFPSHKDRANVTDKPKWTTPSVPPCRNPAISHLQFWHFLEPPGNPERIPDEAGYVTHVTAHQMTH